MTRSFERGQKDTGINDLSQNTPEQPSDSTEIQEINLEEMKKTLFEKEVDLKEFEAIEDKDSRTKKAIKKLKREIKDLKDYIARNESKKVVDNSQTEQGSELKVGQEQSPVEGAGENLGNLKTKLERLNTRITATEKKIKALKRSKKEEGKDELKAELIDFKQKKIKILNDLLEGSKGQDQARFQEAIERTNRELEVLIDQPKDAKKSEQETKVKSDDNTAIPKKPEKAEPVIDIEMADYGEIKTVNKYIEMFKANDFEKMDGLKESPNVRKIATKKAKKAIERPESYALSEMQVDQLQSFIDYLNAEQEERESADQEAMQKESERAEQERLAKESQEHIEREIKLGEEMRKAKADGGVLTLDPVQPPSPDSAPSPDSVSDLQLPEDNDPLDLELPDESDEARKIERENEKLINELVAKLEEFLALEKDVLSLGDSDRKSELIAKIKDLKTVNEKRNFKDRFLELARLNGKDYIINLIDLWDSNIKSAKETIDYERSDAFAERKALRQKVNDILAQGEIEFKDEEDANKFFEEIFKPANRSNDFSKDEIENLDSIDAEAWEKLKRKKKGFWEKYWRIPTIVGGAVIALATIFGLSKKDTQVSTPATPDTNPPPVKAPEIPVEKKDKNKEYIDSLKEKVKERAESFSERILYLEELFNVLPPGTNIEIPNLPFLDPQVRDDKIENFIQDSKKSLEKTKEEIKTNFDYVSKDYLKKGDGKLNFESYLRDSAMWLGLAEEKTESIINAISKKINETSKLKTPTPIEAPVLAPTKASTPAPVEAPKPAETKESKSVKEFESWFDKSTAVELPNGNLAVDIGKKVFYEIDLNTYGRLKDYYEQRQAEKENAIDKMSRNIFSRNIVKNADERGKFNDNFDSNTELGLSRIIVKCKQISVGELPLELVEIMQDREIESLEQRKAFYEELKQRQLKQQEAEARGIELEGIDAIAITPKQEIFIKDYEATQGERARDIEAGLSKDQILLKRADMIEKQISENPERLKDISKQMRNLVLELKNQAKEYKAYSSNPAVQESADNFIIVADNALDIIKSTKK